ncbi:hypothetical protein R1sor_000284 [Riccia sorocarpa]|uniref:Ribosomal RNA-processing protein 7 C-terminal domain-containing protein n=1 Tax=Riccia sorocarpa TaxID=122646 RepID=A0ABD3GSP1_9MARC
MPKYQVLIGWTQGFLAEHLIRNVESCSDVSQRYGKCVKQQRREAKRNEVMELQKKFEEDKKKIATMREARKFRSY